MERYFENVFFAQGEHAEAWMRMIDKHGREFVLDSLLLMYWYPSKSGAYSESQRGLDDKVFAKSLDNMSGSGISYIGQLSYNRNLLYIGVEVEVTKE